MNTGERKEELREILKNTFSADLIKELSTRSNVAVVEMKKQPQITDGKIEIVIFVLQE